jgi:DNA-binding NarL/FixJ family response regulator
LRSDVKKLLVVASTVKRYWDRFEDCFAKSGKHVLVRAKRDDLEGLLEECQKFDPCVLIVDYDSIAQFEPIFFARCVEYGRLLPVLVLINNQTTVECEALLRMGCMGFLRPDVPSWQLLRAVDAVASGEIWAPRMFVSQMCRELLSANDPLKLTTREEEVLALLAAGHSNRKIADTLFITRETVRWHMRAIYRKLGVHDRSSVVSFAGEQHGRKRLPRK